MNIRSNSFSFTFKEYGFYIASFHSLNFKTLKRHCESFKRFSFFFNTLFKVLIERK